MNKQTPGAIEAKSLFVKGITILGLVFGGLDLGARDQLLVAMGVLAFLEVAAGADLDPVLAKLCFVLYFAHLGIKWDRGHLHVLLFLWLERDS